MENNFKKFVCSVLVGTTIMTACGCAVVPKSENNSNSQSVSSSTTQNSTISTSVNSVSSVSASSSSAPSSSKSVHVHAYQEKVESSEFLKTPATYFTPAEYYYSCECGEKGTQTFTTTLADYDYKIVDDYIVYLMENGSYEDPFWNTEKDGCATWNYIDGCMMTAFLKLNELTGDEKYYTFVETFMNKLVSSSGGISGYGGYKLDDINEGRVLFPLYEKTQKQKYNTVIEKLYTQLQNQPRNSVGGFWHKNTYKNQMWLDGLYMAEPFYATYKIKNNDDDFSDIMLQYRLVEENMKNAETGLYYHGWDNTKTQSWADSETGLSKNVWLRAVGWYFASLADLTGIFEKDSTEWKTIQGYLKTAVDDVLVYLDKEKYMFYQVVDYPEEANNYLETSGSALISYAILHAVNTGALDQSYFNVGQAIFNGICIDKLSEDTNGNIMLKDICKVAGLSSDRDGSLNYYLNQTVRVSNEAKGVAPLLMAYTEILDAQKTSNN